MNNYCVQHGCSCQAANIERLTKQIADLKDTDKACCEIHQICADAGIPPGHVVERVRALADALAEARKPRWHCQSRGPWLLLRGSRVEETVHRPYGGCVRWRMRGDKAERKAVNCAEAKAAAEAALGGET